MPIQFRCQHCHQLLGISRSKAGSVVDCPACGRSLRVPGVDGVVGLPEADRRSSADTNFLNALEELSNLPASIGTATTDHRVPAGSERERTPLRSGLTGAVPQGSQKDTMRIVPLSPASTKSRAETSRDAVHEPADILSAEELAPLIIPDLYDTDDIDKRVPQEGSETSPSASVVSGSETAFDLPANPGNALGDLAGRASEAATEPRTALRPSRTRRLVAVLGFTAIVSFLLGYLTARIPRTARVASIPGTNSPFSAEAIPASNEKESEAVQKITGTITFSDIGRESSADTGALVLLLPSANTSGLRLDARPLRNLQQTTAKEAVEVALKILGATITRASDDGTFSLERRHGGPAKLIVISRHASRPDSESLPTGIAAFLAEWFESPAHLTGRLSVQEKLLSAYEAGESGAPIEIAFGTSQQ